MTYKVKNLILLLFPLVLLEASPTLTHAAEVILDTPSSGSAEVVKQIEQKKAGYTVFHPTPKELMREFVTDRPDKTESPYTVDAGHFQLETDLLTYTFNKPDPATTTELFNFNLINLKMGITNNSDLQVIAESFKISTTAGTTPKRSLMGYGDTTIRYKYNLLGNDGGPIALGLIGVVKLPTASAGLGNGAVEGGILLPVALALPAEWSIGFMIQLDRKKNSADLAYHSEFISTMTLGHALFGNLIGYWEVFSQASLDTGASWICTFDTGLIYPLLPNLNLDAGVNIGITDAADDVNPFLGVSFRY